MGQPGVQAEREDSMMQLANKLSSLAAKVGLDGECAICGGGALDVGPIKSLESKLGLNLLVPSHPQHVTALGAAVLAQEKA